MKYASIDIETTGLNPEHCELLQIGIVLDDLENLKIYKDLPKLNLVIVKDYYKGSPHALAMHKELFQKIEKLENVDNITYCNEETAVSRIKAFLEVYGFSEPINIAGKNFGMFDYQFLKKLPNWDTLRFRHRIIDPAILYANFEDERLPDTTTCLKRANMSDNVLHTAIEDALQMVSLIRFHYFRSCYAV
jgi:oligoribonuclease (3'-5' exoribonuclease)